jgi:hypothetical protein
MAPIILVPGSKKVQTSSSTKATKSLFLPLNQTSSSRIRTEGNKARHNWDENKKGKVSLESRLNFLKLLLVRLALISLLKSNHRNLTRLSLSTALKDYKLLLEEEGFLTTKTYSKLPLKITICNSEEEYYGIKI